MAQPGMNVKLKQQTELSENSEFTSAQDAEVFSRLGNDVRPKLVR